MPPEDVAGETRLTVTVPTEQAGNRLDRLLADACPDLSRSRLQNLIRDGRVSGARGTLSEPSYRVKPAETVTVVVPAPTTALPEPQDIPLVVVHEDADLVVIDKPAGMVVHPAPGNPDGTLVNALLAHCGDSLKGVGGVLRPGIVHRLDKDTSGLIVAAKSDAAHAALAAQFKDHSIERLYRALVWGVPSPTSGRIEANIGRHPRDRKRMAVRPPGQGRTAATHYRTLGTSGMAAALIECRLETGRTHQIRVHLESLGHPLIGDPVYGRVTPARRASLAPEAARAAAGFPRQALHAGVLGFVHPKSQERMRFESFFPFDFKDLLDEFKITYPSPA